jgi:ABC-type antimicrobial peptide transport system permease subunit
VTERIIRCNGISPRFFETLGVRIRQGRDFSEKDWLDAPDAKFRSAIINESFARRHFGDQNPIGARLGLGNRPDTQTTIEIVGVVATFSYRGLREVDDQAFFPAFEGNGGTGNIFVRTRVPSEAAFSSIRAAVRRIDPRLPLTDVRTLDDQLDRSLLNERLMASLASAFSGLAILLAVVGLYGVMAFVVSRRTREIGIRLALGCSQRRAVRLMLRDAVRMLAVGIAIGIPLVWSLGRLVESQLFGVQPMDGATIGISALLLALVGLAASALPARRATLRSVTETLRYE